MYVNCTYNGGLHFWFSHKNDLDFFSGMKTVLWSASEITQLTVFQMKYVTQTSA